LYREKQSEISALKDIAPEKIEELKVKLKGAFEHIKEEMRNLAK
jgi:hypothetical protein